jgi:hypothetical protein
LTLVNSSENHKNKELKPFFDEADLISQNEKNHSQQITTDKHKSDSNNQETSKQKIAKLLKALLQKEGINSLNNASSKTVLNFLKTNVKKEHTLKQKKIFDDNQKKFEIHEQDTKDLSKQVSELNRKMFLASAKIQELRIKGNVV